MLAGKPNSGSLQSTSATGIPPGCGKYSGQEKAPPMADGASSKDNEV
jgi:hypothetical protein